MSALRRIFAPRASCPWLSYGLRKSGYLRKLSHRSRVLSPQRKTQFSNLHERRTDVIAEMYGSFKEAIVAVADYTKAFEPVGGPSREEHRKTEVEAANAFAKLYDNTKIFVPASAARKLDELKQALLQFAYGISSCGDRRFSQEFLSNNVIESYPCEHASAAAIARVDCQRWESNDGQIVRVGRQFGFARYPDSCRCESRL